MLQVKDYSEEAAKFFYLPAQEKKKILLSPERTFIGGWFPMGKFR